MRHWCIYHAKLSCRAADPLQVRPCEWVRQTTVQGEPTAATVARTIAEQGVHAKITSREGTRYFTANRINFADISTIADDWKQRMESVEFTIAD